MPSAVWIKDTADAMAADATTEQVFFVADSSIVIQSINIQPGNTLTAHDTNYATITITRYNSDGTSGAVVKAQTTKTSGVAGGTGDWVQWALKAFVSLSNNSLTRGQKLTIAISKAAAGVVVPISAVEVRYTRSA